MTTTTQENFTASGIADALKNWLMVILTLGFVVLYGLALIGKLRPLADVSMILRIEPVLFVIMGYYFGRLPAQQNENTLKVEIDRQTKKAEAAQQAKEQLIRASEVLEEKVRNVKSALASMNSLPPKECAGSENAVALGIANKILTS